MRLISSGRRTAARSRSCARGRSGASASTAVKRYRWEKCPPIFRATAAACGRRVATSCWPAVIASVSSLCRRAVARAERSCPSIVTRKPITTMSASSRKDEGFSSPFIDCRDPIPSPPLPTAIGRTFSRLPASFCDRRNIRPRGTSSTRAKRRIPVSGRFDSRCHASPLKANLSSSRPAPQHQAWRRTACWLSSGRPISRPSSSPSIVGDR